MNNDSNVQPTDSETQVAVATATPALTAEVSATTEKEPSAQPVAAASATVPAEVAAPKKPARAKPRTAKAVTPASAQVVAPQQKSTSPEPAANTATTTGESAPVIKQEPTGAESLAAPVVTAATKSRKKAASVSKNKPAEAPKADKAAKMAKVNKPTVAAAKKPKLIRDSFTLPESDYALFGVMKQRALDGGREIKKSELLRAALVTLAQLDTADFIQAISQIERIKTGRPKK